jgi:hypothetical protein
MDYLDPFARDGGTNRHSIDSMSLKGGRHAAAIMGQLEDVKDIASRLRSKIEHLGASIEELKSRPQPVQEPDMSEVLSELNAAAADVDSLQASVTGPSEEAAPPPADEPVSTVGTTTSAAGSPAV